MHVEHAARADRVRVPLADALGEAAAVGDVAEHRLALGHCVAHFETSAKSEEHTSELQSLMRSSYAVFCLKQKKANSNKPRTQKNTQIDNTHIITNLLYTQS